MSNKRAYRLNGDAIQAIKEIQESDAIQPAEAKIKEIMGEVADAAGLPPDLAYAIRRTALLITDRNRDSLDSAQTAAWKEALAEYQMLKRTF